MCLPFPSHLCVSLCLSLFSFSSHFFLSSIFYSSLYSSFSHPILFIFYFFSVSDAFSSFSCFFPLFPVTKTRIVKAMVFPVVKYGCESWTIKKAEHGRVVMLKRVPWTARRSNQSILKEINPEYSLEGLMLKLKLQYFWPSDAKSRLIGKDPDAGKD